LQHTSYSDFRFVKNVCPKLVEQIEEIRFRDLLAAESGKSMFDMMRAAIE